MNTDLEDPLAAMERHRLQYDKLSEKKKIKLALGHETHRVHAESTKKASCKRKLSIYIPGPGITWIELYRKISILSYRSCYVNHSSVEANVLLYSATAPSRYDDYRNLFHWFEF